LPSNRRRGEQTKLSLSRSLKVFLIFFSWLLKILCSPRVKRLLQVERGGGRGRVGCGADGSFCLAENLFCANFIWAKFAPSFSVQVIEVVATGWQKDQRQHDKDGENVKRVTRENEGAWGRGERTVRWGGEKCCCRWQAKFEFNLALV